MHGDGHWLNYRTGKVVEVEDHERDIRDLRTAASLGVPRAVFDKFHRFKVGVDRCRFLVWLMRQVPLIRHRNHNPLYATYEFWSASKRKPYATIARHARQYPDTKLLNIVNLRTRRSRQIFAAVHGGAS